MIRLAIVVAGVATLLYLDSDRAEAQVVDGGSRSAQNTQERAQRRTQQRGADRPTAPAAPREPAAKTDSPTTPAAPALPDEPSSRRDAQSPTGTVKSLAWTAQELADARTVCLKALAPIRALIDVSEPVRNGDCGTLGSVTVHSVGGVDPVAVSPASPLTCSMVVSLHDWVETGLQPIARALLGVPVAKLTGVATYPCRDRVGGSAGQRSEHALANAIDITAFVTTDGRTVDVKAHWGPTVRNGPPPGTLKAAEALPDPIAKRHGKEPRAPKPDVSVGDAQAFLKAVHRAACRHFTTVLGPEANEAHRDHFHFDLAQRRSAYRLCE